MCSKGLDFNHFYSIPAVYDYTTQLTWFMKGMFHLQQHSSDEELHDLYVAPPCYSGD